MLKLILSTVLITCLKTYYYPISTILITMTLEQDHLATPKICMLVVGKEASTLSRLHGIANCVKNGTRKIISSNRYQHLARCSVTHTYFQSSLRILFTVFFGNENSNLEINVNHFGVLHWQQWQTPASAPHSACRRFIVRKAKIFWS